MSGEFDTSWSSDFAIGGEVTDDGTGTLTDHRLAISPYGLRLRFDPVWLRLNKLEIDAALALRLRPQRYSTTFTRVLSADAPASFALALPDGTTLLRHATFPLWSLSLSLQPQDLDFDQPNRVEGEASLLGPLSLSGVTSAGVSLAGQLPSPIDLRSSHGT